MSLPTRLFKALGALVIVLAIVVGGAWALVTFGRVDGLTGLDWSTILTTRDDGSLALGVITLIGWAAWGMATLSLLSEFLAAISGRRWRLPVPGLTVLAPASAVLVAAIMGLTASQLAAPGVTTADSGERALPPKAPVAASLVAPAQDTRAPAPKAEATHLVQPGDDLWSLAERYYQDGSKWRLIAEANQTILIRGTDHLEPGMLLVVPRLQLQGSGEQRTVTVQPGDTLSSLAATHLGDPLRWPELAEANAALVSDPNLINVGQQLEIPDPARSEASSEADSLPANQEPLPTAPERDSGPSAGPVVVESPGHTGRPVDAPAAAPTTCPAPPPLATPTASVQAAAGNVAVALGLGLAATIAAAFGVRRRQQAAQRPLGRRLPVLPPDALAVSIDLARARDDYLAGLGGTDSTSTPAGETVVTIGHSDGGSVCIDLEGNQVVWLVGDDGDDLALAAAIVLGLVCESDDDDASPSRTVGEVVVAGPELGWLDCLEAPQVSVLASTAEGELLLARTVADRTAALPRDASLSELRADATTAEAWAPLVVVLAERPAEPLPSGLGRLGISVVVCTGGRQAPGPGLTVELTADQARIVADGQVFTPSLVTAPARRALTEIFDTANESAYPLAPWWDESPENETPTVLHAAWTGPMEELPVASTIESDHPVVHLLGTVGLTGARGSQPNRAAKQCVEYCAWLLENPGASSLTMAMALGVAEPTRRSNMSRLRAWLGDAPDGTAYLPEAYTGRIELHPGVTSDWERLQILTSGGVNRVSDAALVQGLGLVRGAPLADAAPGQWNWAEQLRADISAMVRDIGVVLSRRALARGDHDLARWAIDRAQLAAPDDELLTGCRILLAHRTGDRAEVDRLVLQVTRRARSLGVDLSDELVVLLQEVVEGRARQRA